MKCAGTLKRQFAIILDRVYLPVFAFEGRWSKALGEYIWKSYRGVCEMKISSLPVQGCGG